MDFEKVTAGEGDNQEEKNSPEFGEKGDANGDAGGGEAEEVVDKVENGDCEEGSEDVEGKERGTEEFVEQEGMKGKEQGKDGDQEVKSDKGTEDEMEVDEEYVKADEEEDGKKDEDEDEDEEEGEGNETREVKEGKKRSRYSKIGKGETEGAELSSPRTPGIERPARERKTVDRFIVGGTVKDSATKAVIIEKGRGAQLKDIPNVAFKLSKRKADENLQILHTILYGRKTKVHALKKNIGLFSGFVWIENEEKQRTKTKERIDKCIKEKLLDFCDVLNIPVPVSSRKEELTVKLLQFLESPHATTDTLLIEKNKSKKRRKSKGSASKSPTSDSDAVKSRKKLKSNSKSGKGQKHSTEEEDDDKTEPLHSEDDGDNDKGDDDNIDEAEKDEEMVETDEEQAESLKSKVLEKKSSNKRMKKDAGDKTMKKSDSADKNSYAKASSTPVRSKSEKGQVDVKSRSTPSSKKQKVDKKHESTSGPANDTPSSKKKSSNSSTKVTEKNQAEAKARKNVQKEPTREELLAVVADILKDVDFNTATLSDIHKQLGKHFKIDLMHRKAEIKEIITEVINAMSDDEDEGEESGDDANDMA